MINKRYKVWFKRGNVFDTLDAAMSYANLVFRRTGFIVSVTEVKSKIRRITT